MKRKKVLIQPTEKILKEFDKKCKGRPRNIVIYKLLEMYVEGKIKIKEWA